ncbi:MAG: MBOAT family protein [Firmicutes bacterium]|nr:MBOAT family protein [Bacillota bacterium]
MSFTSPAFVLFLAVLAVLYFVVPRRAQWPVLLAGSLVFYLFAGVELLGFLVFTIVTVYAAGRILGRWQERQKAWLRENKDAAREDKKAYKAAVQRKSRAVLGLTLALNFGMLFFCKAALLEPLKGYLSGSRVEFLSLGLPMGISFYLFQSMGYLIDVYRGTVPCETNLGRLALFSSYFPQLVQGPISKYSALAQELYKPHRFDAARVHMGIQRILWGYFKKLVIADRIAAAVVTLKGDGYTGAWFFLLTLFYAVQIYGDFTGGIDITLGVSQILGIPLAENFNHPFLSKNIAEYWRRWHISLGEWMKDYIFYPISVSKPMRSLSKSARRTLGDKVGRKLPVYVASFATWFVTGLWHGLEAHYLVWGMMNCVVIVASEELEPLYARFHAKFPSLKQRRLYGAFEIVRMFVLMNLIRASDLFSSVGTYFSRMFSLVTVWNVGELFGGGLLELGLNAGDYVLLALALGVVFAVCRASLRAPVRESLQSASPWLRYSATAALLVAVLLFGVYGQGYDASSFIYNQF